MLATGVFEAVETVCSAPVRWLLLARSIWVNGFLQFYFNRPKKRQIPAGFSVWICGNLGVHRPLAWGFWRRLGLFFRRNQVNHPRLPSLAAVIYS